MRLILNFVNSLLGAGTIAIVPMSAIAVSLFFLGDRIPQAIAQPTTSDPTLKSETAYFKDIQKHWANSFIEALADRNLISKSPTFQPDRKVTRAEFAVVLDRAFPFQPAIRQAIAFNDVPTDFWAASAIQGAYTKGFIVGDTETFRPNEYMKRSQVMAAIANGLAVSRNLSKNLTSSDPKLFLYSMYTDANLIPAWAIAPIAALTDKQIIVNYPNVRLLNPNGDITKAELSTLIYQSLVHTGQLTKISSNFIANPNTGLFNANDFTSKELITHLKVSLKRREVVAYQGTKKLKTYPLGVGRAGWETPSGSYLVKQIIRNPDWKNPFTGDVIKATDPDNPLNGYWIGFWTNGKDWSGFHGTAQRDSIGKASSHGCLRMYKEDIKAIFAQVTPATIVEISR
jgi:lipoprotein-anchoring transpeptidase ErfK/SrfK